MPYRVFTFGFDSVAGGFDSEELNRFCLNKRVLGSKAEFFQVNGEAKWTVFLEYELLVEPAPKALEEELRPEEKLLFDRLWQWRREQADAQGVPVSICSGALSPPSAIRTLSSSNGL